MSQTVGGLPTDPTTKKAAVRNDRLGGGGGGGGNVHGLWRLSMMLSASQLEVQPGAND